MYKVNKFLYLVNFIFLCINFAQATAPTAAPTTVPVILLHRYSFDDKGTTAADTSGYSNSKDGTAVGAGGDIKIENGVINFKGASITSKPYLDLTANILEGYTKVTIELWASTTSSNTAWNRFFQFGVSGNNDGSLFITRDGGKSFITMIHYQQ